MVAQSQRKEKPSATSKEPPSSKSKHKVPPPVDSNKRKEISKRLLIGILALAFGSLHSYHASTLFENSCRFSHLSTMEREMSFKSESGMYYSFYKTIVEAPSFTKGFLQITFNNLTEYPTVINALERFNLLPEVVLGGAYRVISHVCGLLGIVGRQCWEVNRGPDLPPVESCEGFLQPEYFYLHVVWFFAGLTVFILFIFGCYLSDSLIGGLIAALCFFYNHSECTRIQWYPPLRESFAYPCCLLQMLCVSMSIYQNNGKTVFAKEHKLQAVAIAVTSSLCLTLWQFSQFVLSSQVLIIIFMYALNVIGRLSVLVILCGQGFALAHSLLLMFGNEMLLSSILMCLLASSVFTLVFLYPLYSTKKYPSLCRIFIFMNILILAVVLKTRAFTNKDDGHILSLLKSKFSSYRDFHTLLYGCGPAFDFIGWETFENITKTLLLPTVCLVLLALFLTWVFNSLKACSIEPHVIYNILQLFVFVVMAVLFLRLKLFMTPHMCLVSSLVASSKYFRRSWSSEIHHACLIILIGCMSVMGINQLFEQHSYLHEYSDVQLEEVLEWINKNTSPAAVFAGPMSIMSAVLLSCRRPIVNHPHYEDFHLRERTKIVYSAASRKPPEEVFKLISSLHVDYLIVPRHWCIEDRSEECSMLSLWDIEDPDNRSRPPTCPQIFMGSAFSFRLVFSNDEFALLKLQPPYVEIQGFKKY